MTFPEYVIISYVTSGKLLWTSSFYHLQNGAISCIKLSSDFDYSMSYSAPREFGTVPYVEEELSKC